MSAVIGIPGWGCFGSARRRRSPDYRENLRLPEASRGYLFAKVNQDFRGRTPTVEELVDAYGMSRATAFRWRAMVKARKGEA